MQRTRKQGTPVRTAPIQRPAEGALSYVRPFSRKSARMVDVAAHAARHVMESPLTLGVPVRGVMHLTPYTTGCRWA